MKTTFLILISAILFLPFSCKQKCEKKEEEIKTMMQHFYKKKINFPKDIIALTYNDIIRKNKFKNNIPSLQRYTIVHFFTADCDKCVNELKSIISSIKERPINKNVDYIFIASAPTEKYVIDAILETKFPYPIYYEKEYYSFKRINNLQTSNEIYNTMILNENQEVILFGSFYANDRAQTLFSEIVQCNL